MSLKDQGDGTFLLCEAILLLPGDLLLNPARQILSLAVTVTTPQGTEHLVPWARVRVFRPATPLTGETCPQCGAEIGEPCALDCLSLALLDDTAEEVFSPPAVES